VTTVKPRSEPVLNEKWAAFIQSGLAICVASRDSQNIPSIVRGFGCRVTGNRQRVMVLVAASQAELFLKAVRATGMIAATFTQPSTHMSVQLKGRDATSARARAADVELSKVNLDRFVEDASPLGYPEDVLRTVFWSDPADLIAITFSPTAAFLQTPGPRAGEALSSK
jgi:hypothetical protein